MSVGLDRFGRLAVALPPPQWGSTRQLTAVGVSIIIGKMDGCQGINCYLASNLASMLGC